MNEIVIPDSYNYIGVFLTFACNLHCSYCINYQRGAKPHYKSLHADDWIKGLSRIITRPDLPITLQGGEPTLHPYFYSIINGIDKSINIDLLTNGMFNEDEFMERIPPDRLKRNAPYASIRISYHIENMDLTPLIEKTLKMKNKGYSVGVWIVDHPRDYGIVRWSMKIMQQQGIDCRLKEFLGEYNNKWYGTYKYPNAVDGIRKKCMCKPSELLIAPDGGIHRCHYELYNNKRAYQHILDNNVKVLEEYKSCKTYGLCNGCDIKLKTNRFQVDEHCSVEIATDETHSKRAM